MEFCVADTFQDSLAKLSGEEQKAAKTSAFDLQLNPVSHGLQMHKITESKDKNFWSVRVSRDIRIIVHKTEASLLLCYIDHHDSAYDWAKRRRIENHPKSGAAQLVEVRELVQEVFVPVQMEMPAAAPSRPAPPKQPFASMTADDLLSYGVPEEWLEDVRAATEDSILDIAAAREHCASTTAPRTRFACRRTASSARTSRTWTRTSKTAAAPSPCSTAPSRTSANSPTRTRRARLWASG